MDVQRTLATWQIIAAWCRSFMARRGTSTATRETWGLLLVAVMVGIGHAAVTSITTIYYPSAVRATGRGWASFIAKFAAVAAPFFGARFLAGRHGAMAGYTFTAFCLAGIVLCVLLLAYFTRRFRSDAVRRTARAD